MSIPYAVIGCGGHARQSHIVPGALAGFELRAVYDPETQNAEKAAALVTNPVKICADSDELFALPDIAAVVIVSPDQFHPAQLQAAVEAGKHVLIDKPLALDEAGMKTVRQALVTAGERGLVITSCHPRRFDPPYLWAKQTSATSGYGRLLKIQLDFSYHAPVEPWKSSRSLLLDHFPHEIDFINFLLGPSAFKAMRLSDDFDRYSVAGIRSDGISFQCTGTRCLNSRIYPEEIRLRFERGEILANTKTGAGYQHCHETSVYQLIVVPPTDYEARFAGIMQDFRAAIEGVALPYLTVNDLITNMEAAIFLANRGWYKSS